MDTFDNPKFQTCFSSEFSIFSHLMLCFSELTRIFSTSNLVRNYIQYETLKMNNKSCSDIYVKYILYYKSVITIYINYILYYKISN